MDLLIATYNQGKLKEIFNILKKLNLALYTPDRFSSSIVVKETGSTYDENALLKAQKNMQTSGLITLADDSGLEVKALHGQPGLLSARFAPMKNASDADRRHYLLEKLREKPQPWKVVFICKVALVAPNAPPIITGGVCRGMIIPEERGKMGFGYDPIFYITSQGKTMAELTLAEKNRISHRAKALQKMIPHLRKLIRKDTALTK